MFFIVSKRFLRGDLLNFVVVNGELVEIVIKKIVLNFIDFNVVKYDVGKFDVVVGFEVGIELVELGVVRVSDEGNKVILSV